MAFKHDRPWLPPVDRPQPPGFNRGRGDTQIRGNGPRDFDRRGEPVRDYPRNGKDRDWELERRPRDFERGRVRSRSRSPVRRMDPLDRGSRFRDDFTSDGKDRGRLRDDGYLDRERGGDRFAAKPRDTRDMDRLPYASSVRGIGNAPGGYGVEEFGPSGYGVEERPGAAPFLDSCFVCGGVGHMARSCPSNPEVVARLRSQSGSSSRKPVAFEPLGAREPRERPPPMTAEILSETKCFECGKRGHMARECRFKQGEGPPLDQRCYFCNSVGHIARDCPAKIDDLGGGGGEDYPRGQLSPPRSPPHPFASGVGNDVCYQCGRRGHFARECPGKEGPPASSSGGRGLRPPDRWHNGGPGPMGRNANTTLSGYGGGSGYDAPGFSKDSTTRPDVCYECREPGHFARECPVRLRRLGEGEGGGFASRGGGGGNAFAGEDKSNRHLASRAGNGVRSDD
eukprot:TRINITY_DN38530_c0_g1_i1.p1 TRINITY_DN38530_c0_g1~~TRINITY_DN38530_c0_g1_i1.p1  ORF type:complete len:453 (+),score=25.74 TRINITY_DN38530_c0_g1_i1:175-1533(+)